MFISKFLNGFQLKYYLTIANEVCFESFTKLCSFITYTQLLLTFIRDTSQYKLFLQSLLIYRFNKSAP